MSELKYDYAMILKILKKYEGQLNGRKLAYSEIRQLAGHQGISNKAICRIVKINKIKFSKHSFNTTAMKNDILDEVPMADLVKIYGISEETIYKFKKKYGIYTENQKEYGLLKDKMIDIFRQCNGPLTSYEILEQIGGYSLTRIRHVLRQYCKIFKRVTKGKSRPYRYVLVEGE